MDRAGWQTTTNLDVPDNVTPIFLPSRAPELNPVECEFRRNPAGDSDLKPATVPI
jgi:hypothetical protein